MSYKDEHGLEVEDHRRVRRGINRFLHAVYGDRRYLSQILQHHGLEKKAIARLRKVHLNPFLERLVAAWQWWWLQLLSPEAITLLICQYSLDGNGSAGLSADGGDTGILSEQLWSETLTVLRKPENVATLEELVLVAAHHTLHDPNLP